MIVLLLVVVSLIVTLGGAAHGSSGDPILQTDAMNATVLQNSELRWTIPDQPSDSSKYFGFQLVEISEWTPQETSAPDRSRLIQNLNFNMSYSCNPNKKKNRRKDDDNNNVNIGEEDEEESVRAVRGGEECPSRYADVVRLVQDIAVGGQMVTLTVMMSELPDPFLFGLRKDLQVEKGNIQLQFSLSSWPFLSPANSLHLVFSINNHYQAMPNVLYAFSNMGMTNSSLTELQFQTADAIGAIALDNVCCINPVVSSSSAYSYFSSPQSSSSSSSSPSLRSSSSSSLPVAVSLTSCEEKRSVKNFLSADGYSWRVSSQVSSFQGSLTFQTIAIMNAGYLAVLRSKVSGATIAIVFGTMLSVLFVVTCFIAGWRWHQNREYLRHLLVRSDGRGFEEYPIPDSSL